MHCRFKRVEFGSVELFLLQTLSPSEFTFVSDGPNGFIVKRISFKPFPEDDRVFNLGLVDELPDGTFSDITVSDNKDLERVVGSVALAIRVFLKTFPNKSVFITGSTRSRTRLYRIIFSKTRHDIEHLFYLYGLIDTEWEDYRPNRPYHAFLINLKRSYL